MELQGQNLQDGQIRVRDYLWSPITTLLESLDDRSAERFTIHDLNQTYAIFFARVKTLSGLLRDATKRASAVCYLKDNSLGVTQCIARDILRAMTEICDDGDLQDDGQDLQHVACEHDLQKARHYSELAQRALLLVTEIYGSDDLKVVFSGTHLYMFFWSSVLPHRRPVKTRTQRAFCQVS